MINETSEHITGDIQKMCAVFVLQNASFIKNARGRLRSCPFRARLPLGTHQHFPRKEDKKFTRSTTESGYVRFRSDNGECNFKFHLAEAEFYFRDVIVSLPRASKNSICNILNILQNHLYIAFSVQYIFDNSIYIIKITISLNYN